MGEEATRSSLISLVIRLFPAITHKRWGWAEEMFDSFERDVDKIGLGFDQVTACLTRLASEEPTWRGTVKPQTLVKRLQWVPQGDADPVSLHGGVRGRPLLLSDIAQVDHLGQWRPESRDSAWLLRARGSLNAGREACRQLGLREESKGLYVCDRLESQIAEVST
jgi:hypothetical protein